MNDTKRKASKEELKIYKEIEFLFSVVNSDIKEFERIMMEIKLYNSYLCDAYKKILKMKEDA
jgi:hypothetical protein